MSHWFMKQFTLYKLTINETELKKKKKPPSIWSAFCEIPKLGNLKLAKSWSGYKHSFSILDSPYPIHPPTQVLFQGE